MATPTTSTPSLSTATVRRTCPRTTCASTSGTWPSPTGASVSFPAAALPLSPRAGSLRVRHQLACCKELARGATAFSASSVGCLLAHNVSEAQVWNHDEFIYENFKTAASEGYL